MESNLSFDMCEVDVKKAHNTLHHHNTFRHLDVQS